MVHGYLPHRGKIRTRPYGIAGLLQARRDL